MVKRFYRDLFFGQTTFVTRDESHKMLPSSVICIKSRSWFVTRSPTFYRDLLEYPIFYCDPLLGLSYIHPVFLCPTFASAATTYLIKTAATHVWISYIGTHSLVLWKVEPSQKVVDVDYLPKMIYPTKKTTLNKRYLTIWYTIITIYTLTQNYAQLHT